MKTRAVVNRLRVHVSSPGILAVCAALVGVGVVSTANGQTPSPLERIEALGLETAAVGRVTVHHTAADREHALRLAAIAEAAAAQFQREFGASFPLQLAVLRPEHWFVPYVGGEGEPYGVPWGWIPELLMSVPASLEQGVLIRGPDETANLRRVQFVLLHELGHLASKQYLHRESGHLYSPVRWLEELLATYFAYAFVRVSDPEWAYASEKEWLGAVNEFTPAVISLDWSFMRDLPPNEFVRTYGWYQNLLNVRAARIYEVHGVGFLRGVRDRLKWEDSGQWTTDSLLPILEVLAPGFQAWADRLHRGADF